ncbi:hypothetical protein BDM02DRAFT_596360 [Thelephora ganbajun]|uniref:Uncharacterized protein n=1 Tax=Thelephora ganbajun TaxID=370292 RepID=A0ACB6Z6Z8_THEGA|nr:hypothetical protein BDM02DRAFT_596360 [Thelephora ganbajun]
MGPEMDLRQTGELSAFVPKDAKRVEPELTGLMVNNRSLMGDVGHAQRIPTINDDAWRYSSLSSTSSSAGYPRQQSDRRNCTSSLAAANDDLPPSESSPEVEITSPKHSTTKNHVHASQRLPESSKYISTCISPPQSPSMPTSRAHVEVRPFPNPTNRAISKSFSAVPPQPRSSQPLSISIDDKSSVSKKRKTHYHTSLDTYKVLNPKSPHRLSFSPASSVKVSTSQVDPGSLSTLEYDLDRDPTQEAYEFHDQFHERSPFSAILSARFIHAHLFERLSDSTTLNDELTDSEGDLVTEFIEPAAMSSVGPHDEVSPSYALDSAKALGNSDISPGYGDPDLGRAVHVTDPFTVLTMDDVINHQPWGFDAETVIDPSLLGGTTTFSEPRSPSLAPTPFRDFHSWKRTRTPSPPLTHSVPTILIPLRTSASTSGSNSAQTLRYSQGNLGGGKAKFYKKGTLQTPPHLSNSLRRSVSGKTTENTHNGRHLSSDQMAPAEMDSPLTELSTSNLFVSGTTSTSSIATPSEAANAVGEDATVIDSGSDTPPPRGGSIKTSIARKQKCGTNNKGPYRIIAVNESTHCHQCRRTTPHPKMHCYACTKHYCILCIVKRYHDIEFHQFKEDFECPACLNKCNCTVCCDKRKEVYITTRHIKFDKETMAKLLNGEIRSLPHLSASFAGPRKGLEPGQDPISLRRRKLPSTAGKGKTPARRKRVSSRRYTPDDDDDDGDSDTSKTQNASAWMKPTQAAMQTQRMLEESGSGRYWGTVYSLSGERVGMSYVGSNLQNVTVETINFSSASYTDHSPSPPRQQRKRVYAGKWQDIWGFRPEASDGSQSEDETRVNNQGGNKKELGRARFYYVGNQDVIRSWRKTRSKTVQRPPVTLLPPSDDIDARVSPSDSLPFDRACDKYEATDTPLNDDISIDGGESEDDRRRFWIMEPERPNLPFLAATNISEPGLDNVGNALDVGPTSALESCRQLVPEEALVEALTSSLQAVGTSVSLPRPPLVPSPLSS